MKKLLLILFCVSFLGVNAPEEENSVYTDTVNLVDFLESVYNGEQTYLAEHPWNSSFDYTLREKVIVCHVGLKNKSLLDSYKNDGWFSGNELKKRLKLNDSILLLDKRLLFKNCLFLGTEIIHDKGKSNKPFIIFSNVSISKLRIENSTGCSLGFKNCTISNKDGGLQFYENDNEISLMNCLINSNLFCVTGRNLSINDCALENGLHLRISSGVFSMKNTIIQKRDSDTLIIDSIKSNRNFKKIQDTYSEKTFESLYSQQNIKTTILEILVNFSKYSDGDASIYLSKNTIGSQNYKPWVLINGGFKSIEIIENTINSNISFGSSKINDKFIFLDNSGLLSLLMDRVTFSELKNYIDWENIQDFKLYTKSQEDRLGEDWYSKKYSGIDSSLFTNKVDFFKLAELYKFLYENYRMQGNSEYANACYAEMKQVETRRWKYLYEQNKSFEGLFRWQLNVFLNYFTDYGTNPAKAVIKSGWVILLFAIFYLFFPSDWDVSNRSQLLSKIRDLANKNREKSLLATVGFVLYSSFIHVINALTLSLNAFTTLGFGDIPTHGAARYVTIVQGFIGWFLLTIFSVSLINQVLG